MSKIVELHEKDFLTAYNTQMYQIKKELKELKEKTSKEKMKASNETKIKMLEKERDWFREEALKLDQTATEYKQMLEKMKATLEVVEEDRDFFQDQLFNAKKFNKALNLELQKLTQRNGENPSELPPSSENSVRDEFEMNKMLLNEKPKLSMLEEYKEKLSQLTLENTKLKKREEIYKDTIHTLQKQDKIKKAKPTASYGNQLYENNELKEFFLSCIEEVKKDIIKRRALSSNYSSKKYDYQ